MSDEFVLRVGTWNVHEGLRPDGVTPFDVWAELRDHERRHEELDVVCLQEVPVSKELRDRPRAKRTMNQFSRGRIAEHLRTVSGYPYCSALALSNSSFYRKDYQAIAILSRYPLASETATLLKSAGFEHPNGQRLHDKGVLSATVMKDDSRLRVLCLHGFPLHRFDVYAGTEEHDREVWRVGNAVARQVRDWGDKQTVIVAGDFNFESRKDRIPDFGHLSMRSVFDKQPTRLQAHHHDDVLIGSSWACRWDVHPTQSDHYLLTVRASNDKLPTAGSGPDAPTRSDVAPRRTAARACAKTSYSHPNGFIKVVLERDARLGGHRLHSWGGIETVTGDIHRHRWHFSSHVLSGHFIEYLYDADPIAESCDATLYDYRRSGVRGELTAAYPVGLVETSALHFSAGARISRNAESFHRLVCVGSGSGLTLVRTGPELSPQSQVIRRHDEVANVAKAKPATCDEVGSVLEQFIAAEAEAV